jgi:hypothetical protein
MSFPTVLSPWYAVYRQRLVHAAGPGDIEFYRSPNAADDTEIFTEQRAMTMLFTNLQSAARVAASEGAMIRVLVTKEEGREFGRE